MNGTDYAILHWFNGLVGHSDVFDQALASLTQYVPFIFLILFAFLFFRKSSNTTTVRRLILLALLSGGLALLASVIVSFFIYRPRPFAVLTPDQLKLLIPHAPDSSFPSDHAIVASALAAQMWRAPGKAVRWTFTISAVVVGLTRLVAGVHWPSDIFASFAIGGLVGWGVASFSRVLSPVLDKFLGIVEKMESRFHPNTSLREKRRQQESRY